MDHAQTWAEALNITPESLSRWSAEAPPGQPLLVYCLEKGYVDQAKYLAWASEAFGLAQLQTRFFTAEAGGCDLELIRGARELESYSAWFFPVGRWDDVTYVACVEVPHVDDSPPGYCFLLADARAMRRAWDQAATIEGTSLTSVQIGREGESIETESPEGPTVDSPQGFHAGETKLFTLNLDGVSLNLDGHLAPPPPEPLNREADEPKPELIEDESSIVIDDAATRIASPPPPDPIFEPAPLRPTVPPPPAPVFAAPSPAESSPAEPRPKPIAAPSPRTLTTPPAAGANEAAELTLPNSEAGALTRVFEHVNQTFDQSCVLRRSDDMIKLYKWGLGMSPAGQGVALDLSYPSFLRIVARTKMPYHGYLIDSPTHREFFRGLGLNELPGCVSAVPLIVDSALWGVLLAVAGPDRQDLASLAVVDNAAAQLTTALSPAWRKAA